jgi:DNA-binding MarR family transcriptional regulator
VLARPDDLLANPPEPLTEDPAALAQRIVLQRMPGYLARRLDSRASALYEINTGQSRLTPRQFGLLHTLFVHGPTKQSDLARRLGLDRSTLGEMLQRMINHKLVTRAPTPGDRRTSDIELSALGRATLLRNVPGAVAAQLAFLAPLPDYLRPVFLKCLELLSEAEDRRASPAPDDFEPIEERDQP